MLHRMLWPFLLIGAALGVAAEIVARVLRLWLFRHPLLAALNVVVVYGLIMGGLASQLRAAGPLPVFAAAFTIGLAYELANLQFLHFWHFPDQRSDASPARAAMVVVICLLWGVVPLVIAQGELSLRQAKFFGPPPDPMAVLDGRERDLLQKQDVLQQRLRDVEDRLRDVRKRKERLQSKRQLHAPRQRGDVANEEMP